MLTIIDNVYIPRWADQEGGAVVFINFGVATLDWEVGPKITDIIISMSNILFC